MEDADAPETASFVTEQNKLSHEYINSFPDKAKFHARFSELYNYEKYGCPFKRGTRYFYYHNSGLQNQFVLYKQDSLDAAATVFLV